MGPDTEPPGVMDANQMRQGEIALAEMVSWLAYGTELGSQPDAIELLGSIEMRTLDGPSDLFVFRFRTDEPHWAADRGWMVGVAGPYVRADQPTSNGLGHTFSRFAREDAMTVDEHVNQLVGVVGLWHSASRSRDIDAR